MTDLIARLTDEQIDQVGEFILRVLLGGEADGNEPNWLRLLIAQAKLASALGREEREGVIEECARVCDARAERWHAHTGYASKVSRHGEAVECALAIRALLPSAPDEAAGPITGLTRDEFDAKVFKSSPQGENALSVSPEAFGRIRIMISRFVGSGTWRTQAEVEKAVAAITPEQCDVTLYPSVTNVPERGASAALALPNAAARTPCSPRPSSPGLSACSDSTNGITASLDERDSAIQSASAAPAPGLGEPQRYHQMGGAMCPAFDSFTGKPAGEWIKAADYDALASRLDEAERLIKNLAPTGRYNGLDIEEWHRRALAAEAALAAEKERVAAWHNDGPCIYCGRKTDSLSADPGEWSMLFPHGDDPGRCRPHHTSCVMERLNAVEAERSRAGEMRKDAERYRWLRDESYRTPIAPGPLYRSLYDGIGGTALAEHLKKVWLRYGPALDAAIDAALSRETGQ